MEEMFSLGNVALWNDCSCNNASLTGEVAELFVTKVLGTVILKLKYRDVLYAASKSNNQRTIFNAQTVKGERYFKFEGFDELTKRIEANSH